MELSTAITRLSTARNQVLNRMAAPFGLTAVQMMALHHVSVTPASTPSNLARNLAVDSASVTRLLDRLDNKGMIQRARSEEHTSELQSLLRNSSAVFCLKKKKI